MHFMTECRTQFDLGSTNRNGLFNLRPYVCICMYVCVCVCGGGHVYVVYEDTNLDNDMGIT